MRTMLAPSLALVLVLVGCQAVEDGAAVRDAKEVPFFVGRWAAEESLCRNAAWEITRTSLSTPGHAVCDFEEIENSPSGYEITATCTAEGPPAAYTLKMSYAQSARALLIDGGPFQPVGLVSCD